MGVDMEAEPDKKKQGVAAVDRALSIVHALESAVDPVTLSDLARRTGLYKSTILRLLDSLMQFGHVMKTGDNRYALGPALLRLGMAYQTGCRLEERLMPVFRRLVDAGSESPSFFIRQGLQDRLCVFRLDSHHSTLDRVRVGSVLPLDRGAAGHVIRAFDEGATGPVHDRIRSEGYARSQAETSRDCAALAAPVFDGHGRLAGALSMSGPLSRFGEGDIPRLLDLLQSGARDLCHAFGAGPRY